MGNRMNFDIDSDGGIIGIGNWSLSWENSQDPFFDEERLEGYFAINIADASLEFGAIDQDRPGVYLVRYADGDLLSCEALVVFGHR
jgi:hypothetical protein